MVNRALENFVTSVSQEIDSLDRVFFEKIAEYKGQLKDAHDIIEQLRLQNALLQDKYDNLLEKKSISTDAAAAQIHSVPHLESYESPEDQSTESDASLDVSIDQFKKMIKRS